VYDSYAAVAAKNEVDGRAASSERVDSDFGNRLESTSIKQQFKSGVDTTVGEESHEDTRTESASDARVLVFVNFKHFDIVSDPSDHHYVGETAQVNDCHFICSS
jgi:hypothetical protein